MESLHLTYREATEVIPYRNLALMQRDKLHVVYGELVKQGSGREMAQRRRRK